MYKTFLSWRYMRRRKTNIIGVVGIGVGVGALIMILSIMSGFLDETKKTLRGGLSDVVVRPLQLQRFDGAQVPYTPEAILDVVRADKRVRSACVELAYFGMLVQTGRDAALNEVLLSEAEAGGLAGVRLFGIDVADEYATTELKKALEREPLYGFRVADVNHPFEPPPGWTPTGLPLASVVVGEQLARRWRLSRGSEIEIITGVGKPTTEGLKQSNRRYVVAGTFRSGENETDLARIYMAREELADFLGPPRTFSQVLLKLKDYERDKKAVCEDLRRKLSDAGLIRSARAESGEVATWEDFRGNLLGAIENERVLMAIMLSLVVVVAAFTIFAILSMMVTEKRRDIGILTALGATPTGVTALFLLIGFWDTLVGASGGAVLGMWAAFKIDAIERWLSSTFGIQIFNRNVYLFDHIPSIVNPLWVAVIVLGAFVVALLFALVPAFKAGRLHPLDALRYE